MKTITHFINGEFVPSTRRFEKRSPLTGEVIAEVCEAGEGEVDAAVQAA